MKHIDNMVGLSGAVMQSYSGRPVDFAFIDAGHGYRSVRHDFIMSLHHASGRIRRQSMRRVPVLGTGLPDRGPSACAGALDEGAGGQLPRVAGPTAPQRARVPRLVWTPCDGRV